ncbi:phospholipase-like protein, partial [Tanacetum coccineum]
MDLYHSRLTQDDLNELVIKYKIPLDLHPRLPSKEFVMFEFPADAIGVYHRIFDFSGVRIPFSSFLLALIKHYKVHFTQLGPLGLNKTLCKQGDWFSFAKLRAPSPVCIDDNRSCMKHWKSGFFLIDRRAIPSFMTWRHPSSAIDDPKPVADSYSMVDVRQLSSHVVKLRDMLEGVLVLCGLSRVWKIRICDPVLQGADGIVMGIHDFLCLPEWNGAEVQEDPHHDIMLTLQRLPFYCTPPAAFDAAIPDPTPKDLATSNPSAKVIAKAEASQKRKASTSGPASSHVAKQSDNDDDACYEIPIVTLIRSAAMVPSSGNQGAASAVPAAEGPNTRDSRGNCIMNDVDAAPSVGASRPHSSSVPASSFRDVSGDAIREFFPFSPIPYYATYPEGGIVGNCEFTREEWVAPHQPTLTVLTLSSDQLTAKMSVLHCLMMSRGGELLARYRGLLQSHHEYVQSMDSRLKAYLEKFASLTWLESQSKAKGNKRKRKIKSLTKSLDNLHAEVARLSADLNRATVVEAEMDEEILRLKATPPEAISGIYTFGDATSQRKKRRVIDIENLSGNIIGLALWNEMATEFDMQIYDSLLKPVVIAVISCWVSRYNGLQLSATSATHYYLNPNIPETLHIKQQHEQSTDTTPFLIINNQPYEDLNLERTRNRFPLATLLAVNPQNYQRVRFTSEATIFRINTQKEWYYQRCSTCGTKVIPEVPIAKCKDHGPQMTPIYSNQANTLTRDVHEVLAEQEDRNPYHIPKSLRQVEGTTRTFQFHFDTLSTSRRPDFVLDTVFQDDPLPLPAPPAPRSLPIPPEQMPLEAANPLSPALSTAASNEPEVTEADIPTQTTPQTTPPPNEFTPETKKDTKRKDPPHPSARKTLFTGQQLEVEGEGDENVPLYYYVTDNLTIQFGREEFCLVTGLKFGVENLAEYGDVESRIPFRRRVFPSNLDGEPITGTVVYKIIDSELFDRLDDDDAVSLCCLGILQLVLLGVEGKRRIPTWLLRLANDRVGWDNYPWGSYVWPTLYSQLKNANVKRWPKLYATQPTSEIEINSYSIFGYTWAFKTWILESFRVTTTRYYYRYNRYPRVAAWKRKGKFLGSMVDGFFHGNLSAERLTPDETEARSDWWISSRAYFDGRIDVAERVPRHVNRQNMYEVPSELYRQLEEQKRDLNKQKEEIEEIKRNEAKQLEMFEKMHKFMEDMNVEQTHPNSSSFFNIGTPTHWQIPRQSQHGSSKWQAHMSAQVGPSNWQSHMPTQSATPYWQPAFPSHPGTYNPNLQPSIERHHDAAGLFNQNILYRGKREQRPSFYKRSLYMEQPATTVSPKQRGNKNKNNVKKVNLSPLNLWSALDDENEGGDDVVYLGGR